MLSDLLNTLRQKGYSVNRGSISLPDRSVSIAEIETHLTPRQRRGVDLFEKTGDDGRVYVKAKPNLDNWWSENFIEDNS